MNRVPLRPRLRPHGLALGEVATERDTRGMFRFNPGIHGTFPPYNPYTISACRKCPVAKGDAELAKGFVPENEVCDACKSIRTCYADKASGRISEYKKDAIENAKVINGEEYHNLKTGKYYQSKKSFKRGIYHAYNVGEIARMLRRISLECLLLEKAH